MDGAARRRAHEPWPALVVLGVVLLALLAAPAACRAAGWVPEAAWGTYGSGPGQMDGPKGIAVDAQGYVYIDDFLNHKVMKFAPDGTLVTEWGGYGHKAGRFFRPSRLALGPDGSVYVTDTRNDRVQKFTADGQFVTMWGHTGTGDGAFDHPRGIAVGPDGLVYVTDERNERVEVFTQDGQYVRQWGHRGYSPGAFIWPKDVAVGPDGRVFVLDEVLCRLSVFSPTGELLHYWGTRGSALNQFKGPRGVMVDAAGEIFIADAYNNRLLEFAPDYSFVRRWGAYGRRLGLLYGPRDSALGPDGTLFVTDTSNHRVVLYRLGDPSDVTFPHTTPSARGWYPYAVSMRLTGSDPDDAAVTTYVRFGSTARYTKYAGPFAVRTQGIYTLEYFSVDGAGNQESQRTSGLRVDWTKPVVRTAATAYAVAAGRTLSLRLTASDNLSPSCRFTMVAVRNGREAERAALGTRAVTPAGRTWSLPWTCHLARGQYVVRIEATDLAGNVGYAYGMSLTVY